MLFDKIFAKCYNKNTLRGVVMIRSFKEISDNLIVEVCNCFEKNYDFNFLQKQYPFLDYNVLYSILYNTGNYGDKLYNCLCQTYLNDNKILFISDTHYGSIYENINYVYDVFNFAVANGIHIILHGGDIIESHTKARVGYSPVKQADHFIEVYPSDNSINTYALLGNHDYSAIDKSEMVRKILCSRNDINILGFKKEFLKWCGVTISLHHEIERFKLSLPFRTEFLSFVGHSHFYYIKGRKNGQCEKIYIPPMCDDPTFSLANRHLEDRIFKPGFLTAEIVNDCVVVIYYSFNSGKIVKENEFQKVLKRK